MNNRGIQNAVPFSKSFLGGCQEARNISVLNVSDHVQLNGHFKTAYQGSSRNRATRTWETQMLR